MPKKKHYKTIWVSDVHLGTHECKAEVLADFLDKYTCDKLYLVGDIIDGWHMKKHGLFWPDNHNSVIKKILEKVEKENCEVIYVIGNHDEFLRGWAAGRELALGGIKIVNEAKHIKKNGDVLWVVHGDEYDVAMTYYKATEVLVAVVWFLLFWLSWFYQGICKMFGWQKITLVNYLKQKLRIVASFATKYENDMIREAKFKNYSGVVCGHIHVPKNIVLNDIEYWNTGEWIENCSAVVENDDGTMEIVYHKPINAAESE